MCKKMDALAVDLNMGLFRVLICILFPPLAVLDKGCGAFVLVFVLTLCGWIPGVIAAIVFCNQPATK